MKKPINWSKITYNLNTDLLFLSALTAFWGGIVYYLYALNTLGVIISLFLIIISFIILRPNWKQEYLAEKIENIQNSKNKKRRNKIFLIVYFFLYLLLIYELIASRSGQALISPWQVINHSFFFFYFLASLSLVLILITKNLKTNLKLFLISAHYLLSFSIAIIIYKVGYGFDPFIHQASLKLINTQGLILPKTPYYLGNYSLIIIIHKISGLPISFLNKILIPLLSALFLPKAIYNFLRKQNANSQVSLNFNSVSKKISKISFFQKEKYILLTTLFLLIFGFSPFTISTPQNLSYLFLILVVLKAFDYPKLINTWILALATTVIHPLAGLPALSLTIWLSFKKYQKKIKTSLRKPLKLVLFIAISVILPLVLVFFGGGKWKNLPGQWFKFISPLKNLLGSPGIPGHEGWLFNLIYFIANNYNILLITILLLAVSYYYLQKNKTKDIIVKNSLVVMSLAFLISYLISQEITFQQLINYERANYANRLPIIIIIFLLPFLLTALNKIISKIFLEKKINKIIFLMVSLELLTISLYLSYPRLDKYYNSHGYSTSSNDLKAVELIAQNSKQAYIVLANQQVSAAALERFGFKHYYPSSLGPIYFYPIPTGGPLYQYYLKMVYKSPKKENIIGALKLTKVNLGYLVINKYWHYSDRLIKEAKLQAEQWWVVGGEDYIFRYQF